MVIANLAGDIKVVGEIILISPDDGCDYNIVINNLQYQNPVTKLWSAGNKKQYYIKAEQIEELLPTDQFIEKHFDLLL